MNKRLQKLKHQEKVLKTIVPKSYKTTQMESIRVSSEFKRKGKRLKKQEASQILKKSINKISKQLQSELKQSSKAKAFAKKIESKVLKNVKRESEETKTERTEARFLTCFGYMILGFLVLMLFSFIIIGILNTSSKLNYTNFKELDEAEKYGRKIGYIFAFAISIVQNLISEYIRMTCEKKYKGGASMVTKIEVVVLGLSSFYKPIPNLTGIVTSLTANYFYKKFYKNEDDEEGLKKAYILSIIVKVIGSTALIGYAAASENSSSD